MTGAGRGVEGGERWLTYLSLLSCESMLTETHTHTQYMHTYIALGTRYSSSDLACLSLFQCPLAVLSHPCLSMTAGFSCGCTIYYDITGLS